jgi:hypothetical protein
MPDDQQSLAADLDHIATEARRLADRVRQLGSGGDALVLLRDGEFLTTSQVGKLLECTDQAVRDLIDRAASLGMPIAERLSTWIISKTALFAYLEEHGGGFPERVKAENRFRELWPRWSQAQELRTETKARAAG